MPEQSRTYNYSMILSCVIHQISIKSESKKGILKMQQYAG